MSAGEVSSEGELRRSRTGSGSSATTRADDGGIASPPRPTFRKPAPPPPPFLQASFVVSTSGLVIGADAGGTGGGRGVGAGDEGAQQQLLVTGRGILDLAGVAGVQ